MLYTTGQESEVEKAGKSSFRCVKSSELTQLTTQTKSLEQQVNNYKLKYSAEQEPINFTIELEKDVDNLHLLLLLYQPTPNFPEVSYKSKIGLSPDFCVKSLFGKLKWIE